MLGAVIVSTIIIIFPIFLNIDIIFSKEAKRVIFLLRIFGFIKIISGYIERIEEGFAIHVSPKKAFIIAYDKIFGMRNKVKPLRDFHFIKVRSITELGSDKSIVAPLCAGFVFNYINWFLCRYFYVNKPHLDVKNDVNIYEEKNVFNIYFSGTVVFNLFMIILSAIKILTEKIIYAIGKRIKQNKSSN